MNEGFQLPSRARVQRAWIISTSAPLPRGLRVRSRWRRLARWHLHMARAADVLFVRHPKTGGTWLRAMVTHLYAQKYGLPADRVVRYDELQQTRSDLPRLLTTSGYLSWERPLTEAVLSDPALRAKKLLIMPRHPIDVATSWYNQFRKRTSTFKREMLLDEMSDPIDAESIGRLEYVLHPEIGLPHVIEYHNLWWRIASQHPNALVLRYEDLRKDTVGSLRILADFLGESFTEGQLEHAAAFGSLDNMRTLERDGYFRNRSLRLRDANDPETFKVRRARVGGYRDDFEPDEARRLESMARACLDRGLGYHDLLGSEPA